MVQQTLNALKSLEKPRKSPEREPDISGLWAVITVEDNDGENGGGWACFRLYPTKDEAIKELEHIIREVWCATVPSDGEDPDGPEVSLADRPGYKCPSDSDEKWANTYYSEDRMQAWYDNLDPYGIRKAEVVPVTGLRECCHTC